MRDKTFLSRFQLSVLVSLWLLLSSPIFGQDYRSRIQGSVTDSSDAAIVGAQVTLLNTQTGVSVVQNTNVAGHYLFDLVEPGTYTITVESAGFSKFVQEQLQCVFARRRDRGCPAASRRSVRDGHRHGRGGNAAVQ